MNPSIFSKRIYETPSPIVHIMKTKMQQRRASDKETMDFGQALVSLPPPANALKQLKEVISSDPEIHKLGYVAGLPKLREEIAKYRNEAYKEKITADNVLVTSGANNSFLILQMALTDAGDETLLLEPFFFNHEMSVKLAGGKVVSCPLNEDLDFQPSLEKIKKVWTTKTKILVVTNPNNPTGTIINSENLEALQKFVQEKNGWIIVDESYVFFEHSERVKPKLSLRSTIHIGSFSKSLSLAGWRVGYVVAEKQLISELIKAQDATTIHPSVASQQLALFSLKEKDHHFKKMMQILKGRRDILKQKLQELGIFEKLYGDAGVFIFAKLKDDLDDVKIANRLLEKVGVVTVPGSAFGDAGRGYLRFCYGNITTEEIIRGCELLNKFFK